MFIFNVIGKVAETTLFRVFCGLLRVIRSHATNAKHDGKSYINLRPLLSFMIAIKVDKICIEEDIGVCNASKDLSISVGFMAICELVKYISRPTF